MGHTIVHHWWKDEAMEYVVQLAVNINITWREDKRVDESQWDEVFLNRKNAGLIKPPFTYEAFKNNKDIIDTLNGYDLDIEKFWYVLLFIYDVVMDYSINAADNSKSDYDVLVEINDYLENHPRAVLYLSDDKELRKNDRFETNSPLILLELRRFVSDELSKYKESSKTPEKPYVTTKTFTLDPLYRNYTESYNPSLQMALMYRLFHILFKVLDMPNLKAKKGDIVSYSKLLLISRIIYFCKLTTSESFLVDSSSLKGILKQYGSYEFTDRHSKIYTGGLLIYIKFVNDGELFNTIFTP